MNHVLLLQLPIPRQNFGRKTGNIPLGAACLKQSAQSLPGVRVDILPERLASYLGDAALLNLLGDLKPDIFGFTLFSWNLERSLYLSEKLKAAWGPRIVCGGPEVTPDNPRTRSRHVDFLSCGEGEAVFRRLLTDPDSWQTGSGGESAAEIFRAAESPYLSGILAPEAENLMLLETQRGCPYRCGFCFYNKSRQGLVFAEERNLLRALAWAVKSRIAEVYLLDPSLNSRPQLKALLAGIARLNADGGIRLFSEIRAEAVDDELADLLAAAGFYWFEIGLQSTNPKALELMNRPTRLKRFVEGAERLKARGITPSIDLILGLPGDDLQGFMRSVDFLTDHGLKDDVQIFPLAVLPGTDFRKRSRELGLQFDAHPPYTVTASRGFSPEDFLLAYDYAETRLDAVFFPLPDLDVSWRAGGAACGLEKASDLRVRLGKRLYVAKLMLNRERPSADIRRLAGQLTQPYQLLVGPGVGGTYLKKVLKIATAENPFTPVEVVLFEPFVPFRTCELLAAAHLKRPHFLDGDLRFLFAKPGNRAVLFTLVSADPTLRFQGDMERQVFWWRKPALPELKDLAEFENLDGVLIDAPASVREIAEWQDRLGRKAAEKHHISFADAHLQRRWLLLANPEEYVENVMSWEAGTSDDP
jgi:MoaA/NifB/PqqE/SkfB family radical SAM enzyme